MTNKATLFGGALFSAGLAVGTATQHASADFTFTDGWVNSATAIAYKVAGGGFVQTPTAFGPDYFAPFNYSGYGLDMSAWANPTSMGMTHSRDPGDAYWSYSLMLTRAYFGVSEDVTVQLDWDFGVWNPYSHIQIFDLGAGRNIFAESGFDDAGSESLSLTAGVEYYFETTSRGSTGGGNSFGTMVIPAPTAALPLLAAGGLLATRRRRRE